MSANEPNHRVNDEDDLVDRRRKEQIMDERERINDWRAQITGETATGDLSEQQAALLLGEPVRSFLMTIEPLLRSDDLAGAAEIYDEQVITPRVTLAPPAEWREATRGRPTPGNVPDKQVKGDLEPKTRTVQGLREVIERETLHAEWTVQVRYRNPTDSPDGVPRRTETITVQQPLPRQLLRNAVRTADEWLQDIGIGVETSEDLDKEWEV